MEGGVVVGVDADTEGVYLGGIKDWVCIAKHNKNGYPLGYPIH